MPVEVELNLFSQRPNPTWSLAAPQAEELGRSLASLVQRPARERSPITGYRGFLIRDQPDSGSVRLIRVYGGSVEIPGRGVFLDPDRKVERWLLESAGDAVDPEMRALVLRELEARPR